MEAVKWRRREVEGDFEELMRELLDKYPGLKCDEGEVSVVNVQRGKIEAIFALTK